MSGIELAVTIMGLLETAIGLVEKLHDAHQRQKELPEVHASHLVQLKSIKDVIKVIEDERDLQTAGVTTQLVYMKGLAGDLNDFLAKLDPARRGRGRQFIHQLIRGSDDEKGFQSIMDKFEQGKSTLMLHIQVTYVSLWRDHSSNAYFVNRKEVERVDAAFREKLGPGYRLRIAELIETRTPQDNGDVLLGVDDLKYIQQPLRSAPDPPTPLKSFPASVKQSTERLILRNVAQLQALQINGPVGEDIWKEVDRLVIEDNEAGALSTQINYPITNSTFYAVLLSHMTKHGIVLVALYLLSCWIGKSA